MKDQQSRIAQLNDQFRQGDSSLGLWVTTIGVNSLAGDGKQFLIQAVRNYENFTLDNDPFGEHDFGIIHQEGVEYFWEIICYDKSLRHLASCPDDRHATTRVLTLMRADEYYTTTLNDPAARNPVLT